MDPKLRGFKVKNWKVFERHQLGCRPRYDIDVEDLFEDG